MDPEGTIDGSQGDDGPGRQALNSRSFSKIFMSLVRGTAPELGARSDERAPQTLRAFGRLVSRPHPLTRFHKDQEKLTLIHSLSSGPIFPL